MPSKVVSDKAANKQVYCTHCGEPTDVARRAMSVFCPHCRKRLILEDFKIQTYYAVRDFSTCGDIVVEKKGHVVAPIKAQNLTVRGKVQGRVMARGHVLICKSAWFKGDIVAPTISIEPGAAVDAFLQIGVSGNGVVTSSAAIAR